MYQSQFFKVESPETMKLQIPLDRDYKILQLTDLHLGFGFLSKKKDALALDAVTTIINRVNPDLIVLTGDSIFPYLPKAGTLDNRMQARKFLEFMDGFKIPYTMVMGNHDCEMGCKCNRQELGDIFCSGQYSMFSKGPSDIFGVGNFVLELVDSSWKTVLPLVMLDSNMYGDGWFYSGFDCIHEDQVSWCMDRLNEMKKNNPEIRAMAFFHMPLKEFKEAYEKMKLGDPSVVYHHGSIGEKDDYFGISNRQGTFFEKAVENGIIRWMFCGHDHLNTLSLSYKGIQMTYGMSIDYLGYKGISKQYIQRGGTLITRSVDGNVQVSPVPLSHVVSTRVRGLK